MSFIKNTLRNILSYYNSARQVGHTTMALTGAANFKNAIVVTHNHSMIDCIRKMVNPLFSPTLAFTTLSNFENGSVLGRSNAIVFDNAAVYTLCADALKEIERLENSNELIKTLQQDLRDKERELEKSRDRARNAEEKFRGACIKLDAIKMVVGNQI